MSSLALMRWLEGSPERYDAGMRLITIGQVARLHEAAADAAVAKPGDRVLEIGCGTGSVTALLVARGARVTALDQSPDMIEQAAGGCDDDIDTTIDLGDLRTRADTAIDFHRAYRAILAVGMNAFVNLGGKLARGRQDQRTHSTWARGRISEDLQHRKCKARCLARARLGAGKNIVTFENMRNSLALNRRWRFVALLFDSTKQVGRKAEFVK